jgi:hypothetical protein
MRRRFTFTRGLALALGYALGISLAACSGGHGEPTGPEPGQPIPNPVPIPDPAPIPDPVPTPNPNPQPSGGIQGSYTLERINGNEPGQLVTIADADGTVIGLYRFHASTLDIDALQGFALHLSYTDDKAEYELTDGGEYKPNGPVTNDAMPLMFYSATYGDQFAAVAVEDYVLIHYDFDGDGEPETEFGFRRVG